jgi:hypothetical protein
MHPILYDDIHYIDSQPFKVAKVTTFGFYDQIMNLDYIVWGFRRSCETLPS